MTEKRFTKMSSDGYWKIKDKQADYKEIWDLTNPQLIEDRLNQLNEENEQLKQLIKRVMQERVVDYPLLQELEEMVKE